MKKVASKTRGLSRRGLIAGLGAGAATLAGARAAQAACALTATQVDGPFYPATFREDYDWDMAHVNGQSDPAMGTMVEITGKVLDPNCNPLAGCVIDVWQANHVGRYDHPLDSQNERPVDPNLQSYARIVADGNGEYRIRTIKPGSYLAIGEWVRPPHIHFKIAAPFNPSVTTQMYFSDETDLNGKDLLLLSLDQAQQDALVVNFGGQTADGIAAGTFNIHLAPGWQPPEGLVIPG